MAINVQGGILEQTDVRETITNTEETGVLFNLDYSRYIGVGATAKAITGLHVSPDGWNIYIVYDNAGASTVAQWTFGTRWDISTITETNTKDVDAQDTDMLSVFFKPDGLMMFLTGGTNDKIYSYTLTTAWDISTATSTANKTLTGTTSPSALYWRGDGKQFFYGNTAGTHIFNWVLTTAWDISTGAQLTSDLTGGAAIRDVHFSKDGLKVFTVDNDEFIDVYTLTKPFLVSSKGTVAVTTIVPIKNLRGITFNTNGSLMYVGANDGGEIYQYALKRGWK